MEAVDLDEALQAARAGKPAGFTSLFNALGPPVAGYLRALGARDPEDLANEVFLRAFSSLHTLHGDGTRFRSWLFSIAHNCAIDDRRRSARRPRELPIESVAEPHGGDVEGDVIGRLAEERVHALLDRLTPDQREVLLLRIVGDCSLHETAAVLGKSYEAVKAHQRRGLETLRHAIAAEEYKKGVPQ
ncbi:MAG: polymerase, sigma-24 subunit, subfamily [Actinomycetia bacterium]|nr:polymerase, sigma-24 subunit, subfamily [Actinomycetes bacterium]